MAYQKIPARPGELESERYVFRTTLPQPLLVPTLEQQRAEKTTRLEAA